MRLLIITALAGLTACAQPEPIVDYNAPYTGKYTAPVASVRPEARPMQRRWLACPDAQFNEDCGNGEIPNSDVEERQTSVPETPQAPSVPTNPIAPEEPPANVGEDPTDNGEPEQPLEPEPETHEPSQECPA
jgi:hypothetical protein